MRNWKSQLGIWAIAVVMGGIGIAVAEEQTTHKDQHAPAAAAITDAIAVLHPTTGNTAHGWVRFTQDGHNVKIVSQIEGLEPNSEHGFHIHEYGDCSAPDATSAGGHYNPGGHQHGAVDAKERHAGDMGKIKADAKGVAHVDVTVDNITINGAEAPILGRGVIVHAKPDDYSQPVGNAGARIACGVIGVAKPATPAAK